MGWFSFGRSEGFPTQYPEQRSPVTVDVLEAGFIAAFLILLVCFCISFPSTRLKNNLFLYIRVVVSLLIGLFIMLSNFGQEWEVAHIKSKTPYKAGTGHEINATIGLKIGLRGINVTLNSPVEKGSPLKKEIIDYNERFEWTWDQGRFGFGPYAGHLQRQFRAAQYKGLPTPILWIVDYFVIDGEGFRFGRFYRTAGWYTHIVIWTAFPCWLLANIFFTSVIRFGGYFLGIAGGLLLLGNLLWSVIRNPNPLVIPFEDAVLITKFGFSYWLTLVTGIICVILASVILFFEAKYDIMISIFFGVDPLTVYDEYYLTKEEIEVLRHKDVNPKNDIPLIERDPEQGSTSQANLQPPLTETVRLKRQTTFRAILPNKIGKMRAQMARQQSIYGNMQTIRDQENLQNS